jgi:hypothetical protein
MKIRDEDGKYKKPLPPYYCKNCGVLLTEQNWHDCRRNTKIHGRYYICKNCEKRRNDLSRKKNRKLLEDEWDGKCCICGKRSFKMVFHEINWINHKTRHSNTWYRNNFNRFIFVCYKCHHMLHQLHDVFGFEIEDLIDLINKNVCEWYKLMKNE